MTEIESSSKSKSVHVFALIFTLILLASFLTYLIPAGEFQRTIDSTTGQALVVPESYTIIESSPVAPWLIPIKFFNTLTTTRVAELIFFIFIIGGSFEIVIQSGCIAFLCRRMLVIFGNRSILIIPVFIMFFSILGFAMGLTTVSIVFVPLGIAIAHSLDFDTITGTAMVMLGANVGFAAGIYNPFTVGIAHTIAEIPMFTGAWIRWLLLVFLVVATSLYIIHMTKKSSPNNDIDKIEKEELWKDAIDLTDRDTVDFRQLLVLASFVFTLCIITLGVSNFKWRISEIAVSFLILGIVAGLLSGFGINRTCDIFISGSKKMIKGALVIGLASTMHTVLVQGRVLDTIAYTLIDSVNRLPAWGQLLGMFYSNAIMNLVITSGSTQAALVIPIMVPMADALDLSRQSVVLAYQLGDGLVNLVSPISTTLTGCLAVSGIKYDKWLKFYLPLIIIYMLIGTGFTIFASFIGY
ncbi:YfcC family protein [Alkaliphilus peptidifermentans]|uniref:Uncharacterized membrane protein YfcC, ion transporter superfamily n=1 Tax=Alkaliphilus peptidifermentans DSM 18978 TaxID=1120976 RepID=A0A1G5K888_9FIRM|nr:AbgT family transporter [Alkaliphilus peptidifermentans]SCY96634.1 Uncharacterized membrane protein YfcC, ion transporter superfamily [Alkaliphilus peptidifermentans DSM 18978]